MKVIELPRCGITMEFRDGNEPTYPDAKWGDCVEGSANETPKQRAAGLAWCPCAWCGRQVLVTVYERRYERCACGAIRCYHTDSRRHIYEEGWRKDGKRIWFC